MPAMRESDDVMVVAQESEETPQVSRRHVLLRTAGLALLGGGLVVGCASGGDDDDDDDDEGDEGDDDLRTYMIYMIYMTHSKG